MIEYCGDVSSLSYVLLLLPEVEREYGCRFLKSNAVLLWPYPNFTLFNYFKYSPYPVPKWILLFKLGGTLLLIEIVDDWNVLIEEKEN